MRGHHFDTGKVQNILLLAFIFVCALSASADESTAGTAVPGGTNYPNGGMREVGLGSAASGEYLLGAGAIDSASGYGYFVAGTIPRLIVKFALGVGDDLPTRVAALALPAGLDGVSSIVIDPVRGYALCGTTASPGNVLKVALGDGDSTPTLVSVLTLNTGENVLSRAVIDPGSGYAYFATNTQPVRVVKVGLGQGNLPPVRIGLTSLLDGERPVSSMTIHPEGGYACVGMFSFPGQVVKVGLGSGNLFPSRLGGVTFPAPEDEASAGCIDPLHGYAYFGTFTNPLRVVKVNVAPNTPVRIGSLTLNAGENRSFTEAMIDPAAGHCFFATETGFVVKVGLGEGAALPTRIGALKLSLSSPGPALMDSAREYAYYGIPSNPFQLLKATISQKRHLKASKILLLESGIVSSVSFYSHGAQGNLRLAIYDDSSPKNLLWQSGSIPNTAANDWVTAEIGGGFPSSLNLNAGTYWLGWQVDTSADVPSYTQGSPGDGFYISQPFGPAPAQLDASATTATDETWSMYLSKQTIPLTPSPSPTASPAPTATPTPSSTPVPESSGALHQYGVGSVLGADFNADGSRLVTFGGYGVIVWDTQTGDIVKIMKWQGPAMSVGVLSPDGTRLATAGAGTEVTLWDINTGQILRTLPGLYAPVTSLLFYPDGLRLAGGLGKSGAGEVRTWDTQNGQTISTSPGFYVNAIRPDNTLVTTGPSFSSSRDGSRNVKLGNVGGFRHVQVFETETNTLLFDHNTNLDLAASVTLTLSPDGSKVFAVWYNVNFSPYGYFDLVCSDVSPPRDICEPKVSYNSKGVFSPDGSKFLSLGTAVGGTVFDTATGQQLFELRDHVQNGYSQLQVSADGSRFLASNGSEMFVWDTETAVCVGRQGVAPIFQEQLTSSQAMSSDGTSVMHLRFGQEMSGGNSVSQSFWDVPTGAALDGWYRTTTGLVSFPSFGPFSPNQAFVILGGGTNGNFWLLDSLSGAIVNPSTEADATIGSFAFSRDGTQIVSGDASGRVHTWSVPTLQKLKTFSGHTAWLYGAIFSPDGSRILSGSEDKTAKLWDAVTETELSTLTGHTAGVRSVAFSPNGTLALTGAADGTARLWDSSTGAPLVSFIGQSGAIDAVAFLPDGEHVLTGASEGTVFLRDINGQTTTPTPSPTETPTPTPSRTATPSPTETASPTPVPESSEPIRRFGVGSLLDGEFNLDGTQLTTYGSYGRVTWDVQTGSIIDVTHPFEHAVTPPSTSGGGRSASFVFVAPTYHLRVTEGGNIIYDLDTVIDLCFQPLAVSMSADGSSVYASWENCDQAPYRLPRTLWHRLPPVAPHTHYQQEGDYSGTKGIFSPDGSKLLVIGTTLGGTVYDTTTDTVLFELRDHVQGGYSSLDVCADGSRFLASNQNEMFVWDTTAGVCVRRKSIVPLFQEALRPKPALSSDGQEVIFVTWDQGLPSDNLLIERQLNVASGATPDVWSQRNSAPGYNSKLTGISDDGSLTAFSSGGALWLVDASGQILNSLSTGASAGISFDFSADTTRLLTGGPLGIARLWSVPGLQQLMNFSGHSGNINEAVFSSNGSRVLTVSDDWTAKLWNPASPTALMTFIGHSGVVKSAALSPDGSLALTGSADGTARLWDTASGAELRRFTGQSGSIDAVAFLYSGEIIPSFVAPGGALILTASSEGTAFLRNIDGSTTTPTPSPSPTSTASPTPPPTSTVSPTPTIPPGDNCSVAFNIPGFTYTIANVNLALGYKDDFTPGVSTGGVDAVWILPEVPEGMAIKLDTFGSAIDTILTIYSEPCSSAGTVVAFNDNWGSTTRSKLTFTPNAGTMYFAAVEGKNGAKGNINLRAALVPPGDDCGNTFIIPSPLYSSGAVDLSAGYEDDFATGLGFPGGVDAVWTLSGLPAGIVVNADTIGSAIDTVLTVYSRSSCSGNYAPVGANNDSGENSTSKLTFVTKGNQNYMFVVEGFGGQVGSVNLNLNTLPAVVAGDNCTNPFVVSSLPFAVSGIDLTQGFVDDFAMGEYQHGADARWILPIFEADTYVTVDASGSNFDTLLAVVSGACTPPGSIVALDDDSGEGFASKLSFMATAGVQYAIIVDGFRGANGLISLSISSSSAPIPTPIPTPDPSVPEDGTPLMRYGVGNILGGDFLTTSSLLATYGSYGTVIWDVQTASILQILRVPGHAVTAVAFSPDGTMLATGAANGEVILRDVSTWQIISTLAANVSPVTSLVFFSDSARLAVGYGTSSSGEVRILNIANGQVLRTLTGFTVDAVWRDGSLIATNDGVYNVDTGTLFAPHPAGTLSRDGSRYAKVQVVSSFYHVLVYDFASGNLVFDNGGVNPESSLAVPFALHLSADGSMVFLAWQENINIPYQFARAHWWNVETGAEKMGAPDYNGMSAIFSPDAAQVLLIGRFLGGKVYDTAGGAEIAELRDHIQFGPSSLSLSADGEKFLSSGGGNMVVWNTAGAQVVARKIVVPVFQDKVLGTPLLTSDGNQVLRIHLGRETTPFLRKVIWDLDTGTENGFWHLSNTIGDFSTFSRDGSLLALGTTADFLLYDGVTGALLNARAAHASAVRAIDISPDNLRLLSASSDTDAKIWSIPELIKQMSFTNHDAAVNAATFSLDGSRVLTGSDDRTAKLWAASDESELLTFRGHQGPVKSVALSPNGLRAITGSSDGTARLWDAYDGAELLRFTGQSGSIDAVAFLPDGERVLTAASEGTVFLRGIPPVTPAPSPTASPTPTVSMTPTVSPTPTESPTASPTETETPGPTPTGSDDSTVEFHTIPGVIAVDHVVPVQIAMNNTGNTTWTREEGYSLMVTTDNCGLTSSSLLDLGVADEILPGQTAIFSTQLRGTLAIAAPCILNLRMSGPVGGFFGEFVSVSIIVLDAVNDAIVLGHTIPGQAPVGQSFGVGITLWNSGTTTWSREESYALVVEDQTCPLFAGSRIEILPGTTVLPGEGYQFVAQVTLPEDPGQCSVTLRMVEGESALFGDEVQATIEGVIPSNAVQDWAVYE